MNTDDTWLWTEEDALDRPDRVEVPAPRWTDVGPIGAGGMGEVRRVRDEQLGRTMAMKLLHPARERSADDVQRFVEEAQLTAQLGHQGVVPVYALGRTAQGRLYFTMEEVAGETLAEVLAAGRLRLRRVLSVFHQVCETMAFAHDRGVVHCDLKPDNIMVGAYERLAADNDVVVIEGAGSPAEFNLREGDIVNMAMAHHAGARALLVGDIERGGVFASLAGTLAMLTPADRVLFQGFIINRFRGDPSLLDPALAPFRAMTGVPVRGVIPLREDLDIDAEDGQGLAGAAWVDPSRLDVCVIHLPTVANFTDLEALGREPGARVRYARAAEAVGSPDLLVLPGARDTLADLRWLRARGLDRVVLAAAARGCRCWGSAAATRCSGGGWWTRRVRLAAPGRRRGWGCCRWRRSSGERSARSRRRA